jgi:hypothetical protein
MKRKFYLRLELDNTGFSSQSCSLSTSKDEEKLNKNVVNNPSIRVNELRLNYDYI